MSTARNEEILRFIERLTKEISLAHTLSLSQIAHILEIAKLDLKLVAYGISDEELREFTRIVGDAASSGVDVDCAC